MPTTPPPHGPETCGCWLCRQQRYEGPVVTRLRADEPDEETDEELRARITRTFGIRESRTQP